MADRPLETAWPELVDSTGTPGTGTKIKKATFDEVHDAVEGAIYAPAIDEGPPEIATEVVEGRGSYPDLAARFAAVEAAAAGGLSTSNLHMGGLNVVPNDAFVIWSSEVANDPPDYFGVDAGFTSLVAMTAQPSPNSNSFYGRNFVALTNPDTTTRYFYITLIAAASLTSYGAAPLKNALVGAGAFLYSTTPNAATVTVFDGITNHQVGEQGATTDAWLWSGAAGGSYDGGATLGASSSQLVLRIGVKAAATVYVASPALVFGADSLTRWPGPTPARKGQWVWGISDDGQIGTGVKASFYPINPVYIFEATLRWQTLVGTNTYLVKKDSATLFTLTGTAGVNPAGVKVGSFGFNDELKIECSVTDASARGPSLQMRYLEYTPPLEGAFGGGVVVPV